MTLSPATLSRPRTVGTVGRTDVVTAVAALRGALPGAVHAPGDAAYDALVTPWNLAVTLAPAVVVAPTTGQEVALVVRTAAAYGLSVGVQCTGHGADGAARPDVLVSTRRLDELAVDPAAATARVGAGLTWAPVVQAAAAHGLLPVTGSSTGVGVVGFLTGGGVGPFARTDGLAADRVRALEVVTGDGELRRVTPTQHPDLFRVLRGGKGAAGIVTAVELDLVRRSHFYGGALYLDGAHAAQVVHAWRRWAAGLPEEATTSVALLQLPELPTVPPPLAGRLSVSLRFAWTGTPADGERWLRPMREVATVLLDDVALKPVTALDSIHADPQDPMPGLERGLLLRELTAEAVDALLAVAGPGSGSPQVVVELRHLGGALAREGAHPSAFDHRHAVCSVLTVGIAMDPAVAGHAETVRGALAPWEDGGVWPNFGPAHDDASARRAYTPSTLRALAAAVADHDPDGVLAGGRYLRALPAVP
ncbi:FAD-binding oxidoreductase [Actinotalea sp. Marseille-Q4924]|uniref:FAD-binding oxidoreductase n=1 Tax=Actinotalea sp. Marseille-Q4924 TaxID=2866571 RepID=UPI001CE40AC8|nr:FAD-binding oxidoreductase [Actinotalea sp. Marseille-Q4924]